MHGSGLAVCTSQGMQPVCRDGQGLAPTAADGLRGAGREHTLQSPQDKAGNQQSLPSMPPEEAVPRAPGCMVAALSLSAALKLGLRVLPVVSHPVAEQTRGRWDQPEVSLETLSGRRLQAVQTLARYLQSWALIALRWLFLRYICTNKRRQAKEMSAAARGALLQHPSLCATPHTWDGLASLSQSITTMGHIPQTDAYTTPFWLQEMCLGWKPGNQGL